MDAKEELGEFLRASRARLRPEDCDLPTSSLAVARRVPGLRREEVAHLAGVSVDYYTRLEQGRTGRVGESVFNAVATALRFNATERDYFANLLAGRDDIVRGAEWSSQAQRTRPGIHRVVESLVTAPAFVLGRGMELLAMNSLARAVLFDFQSVPARDRNLARWTFLNPAARERYIEWQVVASDAAAILRMDAAESPNDRDLKELIGDLSIKSPDFARMWSRHNVYECTYGTKRLFHPAVGRIDVDFEALPVPGAIDQKLFVYTAPSGSPSAERLAMLASLTAADVISTR